MLETVCCAVRLKNLKFCCSMRLLSLLLLPNALPIVLFNAIIIIINIIIAKRSTQLCHTSDLKIGTIGATMPGAWRSRISARNNWPDVSILRLGNTAGLICSFFLSVAALHRSTSEIQEHVECWDAKQPTNKTCNQPTIVILLECPQLTTTCPLTSSSKEKLALLYTLTCLLYLVRTTM